MDCAQSKKIAEILGLRIREELKSQQAVELNTIREVYRKCPTDFMLNYFMMFKKIGLGLDEFESLEQALGCNQNSPEEKAALADIIQIFITNYFIKSLEIKVVIPIS